MKLFVLFAILVVGAAAAPSEEHSEESTAMIENNSSDEREKRTLGIDENIEKTVDLITPSGGMLHYSKKAGFNDGGAIIHLPTLLDSAADNKKKILDTLGELKQQKLGALQHNLHNHDLHDLHNHDLLNKKLDKLHNHKLHPHNLFHKEPAQEPQQPPATYNFVQPTYYMPPVYLTARYPTYRAALISDQALQPANNFNAYWIAVLTKKLVKFAEKIEVGPPCCPDGPCCPYRYY